MLKGLLISFCAVVIIGLIFMFPGETMSSGDMKEYTLSRAYLAKNTEHYARCYNSVHHGSSGLINVEIALMGEYFNDQRVNSEAMKPIGESFLNDAKLECEKTISDYESAYEALEVIQMKSESLSVGWRTFIFGGGNQSISVNEVLQYSPARARMSLAFNDYTFTEDQARAFYKEQLGL